MSYSTLLAIYPGEKVEEIQELRNSWGSAPFVWNELCKMYLGCHDNGYFTCLDKLWGKYKDRSIALHRRAVLMMTYDRAYILKKDYGRAAEDIRKFLADFPPKNGNVNHWPYIADFLAGCEFPAFAIYHTSVSENPFHGKWNEEKEDYDPIDWSETFDIYSELDAPEQATAQEKESQ